MIHGSIKHGREVVYSTRREGYNTEEHSQIGKRDSIIDSMGEFNKEGGRLTGKKGMYSMEEERVLQYVNYCQRYIVRIFSASIARKERF